MLYSVFLSLLCSKVYGTFDWQLSKRLHSSPKAKAVLLPGPYLSGAAPDRVLVLPPAIVSLGRTRNIQEYKRVIAGLVQVRACCNRPAARRMHAHVARGCC